MTRIGNLAFKTDAMADRWQPSANTAAYLVALFLTICTGAGQANSLLEKPPASNDRVDELLLPELQFVDVRQAETNAVVTPQNSLPLVTEGRETDDVQSSVLFEKDAFTLQASAPGHALAQKRVEYQAGWLESSALYQPQTKQQYSPSSIVNGRPLPLPSNSFGAYGQVKPGPHLSLTAGIHEDVLHRWDSDNTERNAYFCAVGIEYSPEWSDSAARHYHLALWRRQLIDQGKQSSGLALNIARQFDHQIDWSPFLNFSYQHNGDAGSVETIASAGINVSRLPWNPVGSTGVAYAHEQGSDAGPATHSLEMYYRLLLTPYLEVTPNMQMSYQRNNPSGLQQSLASRIQVRLLF